MGCVRFSGTVVGWVNLGPTTRTTGKTEFYAMNIKLVKEINTLKIFRLLFS